MSTIKKPGKFILNKKELENALNYYIKDLDSETLDIYMHNVPIRLGRFIDDTNYYVIKTIELEEYIKHVREIGHAYHSKIGGVR